MTTMYNLYETHRVISFDEVIGLEGIISKLKQYVKNPYLSNFLFHGIPGTCKTATAHILTNALLDKEETGGVYTFNASDERGIDFVRNEIKTIISNAGFDIIILDEADALTVPAQQNMRILMDDAMSSGKMFILIGNDKSKFIEAIMSRVTDYYFPPLSEDTIITICKNILDKEKISYIGFEDYISTIAKLAKGDARDAISNVQSSLDGGVIVIDPTLVLRVDSKDVIRGLLKRVREDGDFMGLRSEFQYLLYRKEGRVLPSEIVDIVDEWSTKAYEDGELVEFPYIQTRMAIKKIDGVLIQHGINPVYQLIGFFSELRLIELQNR